jgi:phosphoribosylformylglycinamidine synthase
VDLEEGDLTLTHNLIGRHQSRIVRVKTCSTLSPWFLKQEVGDILPLAISHGEGRLICSPSRMQQLASNGQIAAQYVDLQGNPSMDILFNPSGSSGAVEALTSPDGRIMGRMGHSERMLRGLYKNIPGVQDDPLFSSAVSYFA